MLGWGRERRQQLFHRKMGNVGEKLRLQIQKRENQRTKQIKGEEVTQEEDKQKEGRNRKNLKEHCVDFFDNINNHSLLCCLHSNPSHLRQQYLVQGTKSLWNGRQD